MKTAIFLSCLLAGSSMMFNSYVSGPTTTMESLPAVSVSKTKRTMAELPSSPIRIVIDKSDYELHVYEG
jgi:hypothetical protein